MIAIMSTPEGKACVNNSGDIILASMGLGRCLISWLRPGVGGGGIFVANA
jgi:hypothetical protein